METRTLADFEPYRHQAFVIQLESGQPYALELVELRDLGAAPGPAFRKPFALTFRNPEKTAYLPQRTYHLEHEQLGGMDLFLVPLGPDASGMLYEITFS
jgi:hypothetical protein